MSRQRDKANSRAATQVNAVSASSTPPASNPTQPDLFPGRACPPEAKPATVRRRASARSNRRDGVQGGGTRRKRTKITGEILSGPAVEQLMLLTSGREAYKGNPRNRGNDARQEVGDGHSTDEPWENHGEERAVTSTTRSKRGKTAGLRPRGYASSRPKPPKRLDKVRKLQRTLYRVAKSEPERRFTWLYDKVCRLDILQEAWRRVKANGGAAGVDKVSIATIEAYGEDRFLEEIRKALQSESYRSSHVRRVHIPKPGQPGRTRPLGIPTVKDRVVQMAVKLVIEPLFDADFRPCSFGFRPKKTARQALSCIAKSIREGYSHVVDVDLKSYFDTIDHTLLMGLVERRVGDKRVLRLIRAWLKAGVMEEGKVHNPVRGSPQGGVISPLLSNLFLHEVDRQWQHPDGMWADVARLIRYADDMVLLTRSEAQANQAWQRLQEQFTALRLTVNEEKSQVTTVAKGFTFLGFEFRQPVARPLYMWPRAKAVKHLYERVRETVRSIKSSAPLNEVIRKLNPVLIGWCTYFRVGNSNRVFHKVDWAVRSEVQLWLRRKHRCEMWKARRRWHYRYLHEDCRLYRMVGKVSHLEGLRRKPPEEGGRKAGCGKTARPV